MILENTPSTNKLMNTPLEVVHIRYAMLGDPSKRLHDSVLILTAPRISSEYANVFAVAIEVEM